MGERAHLTLVHATRCACFPWRLGWMHNVPVQAATCRECGLDIAQPVQQARDTPICIYCAIDEGWLYEDGPITGDPVLIVKPIGERSNA